MIKDFLIEWVGTFIIVAILLTSFVGYKAYKSDAFQRRYFPKDYWTKEVQKLESDIDNQEMFLEHTRIELAKQRLTMQFDVIQEVNLAKRLGDDTEEARRLAIERIREEIRNAVKGLRELNKNIAEDKEHLNQTRQELLKYQ